MIYDLFHLNPRHPRLWIIEKCVYLAIRNILYYIITKISKTS